MDRDTFISPEDCVIMRFATDIEEVVRPAAELMVAYQHSTINKKNNIKNNKMSKNSTKLEGILGKFKMQMRALFTGELATMNKLIHTADAGELNFYELGEDDAVSVGDVATLNGEPADGEITTADGTVYVFESGKLVEIKGNDEEPEGVTERLEVIEDALGEALNSIQHLAKIVAGVRGSAPTLGKSERVSRDFVTRNFKELIVDVVNSITYADKVNINNAIWKNTFAVGDIPDKHTLVTGVRNGNIPTQYGSEKWSLGKYGCRTGICMCHFDDDFNVFWNMYKKTTLDPTKAPDTATFLKYLMDKVEGKIKGTVWCASYLGDTDSENPFIMNNDGFFTQAEAGEGIKIRINESDPSGEDIYKYLQQAYEATVDSAWGDDEDVVFKMTYAMANNLVMFLNSLSDMSKYNCECVDPNAIAGKCTFTVNNLRVFGIPVEVHREIDGSLYTIGSAKKYRAVLVRKSNMLIGTGTHGCLEMFDVHYSQYYRSIFIDAEIYIGSAIPLDEYVYISN